MDGRIHQHSALQTERLRRFGVSDAVDIHCHCLPGLDDGPADDARAVALCRELAHDGLTVVIATPHALGRYKESGRADRVRRAVSRLNALLGQHAVPLSILPGADIRIDPQLGDLLDADEVLATPDGGGYVLIELPHSSVVQPQRLVRELLDRGLTPILTHPERNAVLSTEVNALLPWLKAGAVAQVTAGSLLGDFGATAYRAAWRWLAAGHVALVATDAHDTTSRKPRMTAAIDAISKRLGEGLAGDVCLRNPLEVMRASQRPVSQNGERIAVGGLS